MQTAFDLSVNSFWEVFLKKITYILSFSHTEQTLFGIQSEIFQQSCQKRLSNFYSIPDIERKSFALLTKKMQYGCQNCFLRVYRNSLNGIIFQKKSCISFISLDMSKKILAFCQIYFDWIVKSVFYEPKRTSWRKIFSKKIENNWVFKSFWDFDQKKNWISGKVFSAGLQKLQFTSL